MDDKIVIISPIYHDNITYVTNANVTIEGVYDDQQVFTEAVPVIEREPFLNIKCFYVYYNCVNLCLTCCCTTMVCFIFFIFIGGGMLFFDYR